LKRPEIRVAALSAWATSLLVTGTVPPRPDPVLARYDFAEPAADRWKLPRSLDEISGLAVDARGRVFAHDDERAAVVGDHLALARREPIERIGHAPRI
jgi:streptogramin lyase